MFRWAIVNGIGEVVRVTSATMDVPPTRQFEYWVIVPQGTKWQTGLTYNYITGEIQ